ncbi:signal peptidase I [Aciduricibacillus chroicocephali]|uniref:Signal peptidase I n=1 Tax=Aciduricibacillus chroicocephali TaxID=3054939 RepID=A0ABY9KX60_9BACI|nr:signal peptidase I [Bacillaceae bacterium 44XB]
MNTVGKEIWSFVRIILFAIIFAYIINHFLLAPYVVKGESMHPNLQEENKLVINKLSQFSHYKRFDIIVFNAPDEDARYVKRIIGLPGDTIVMKNDILYINGKAYDESYLQSPSQKAGLSYTGDFTLEELTGYEKVPKGSLFVLGDNRAVSKDSRYFGLLSKNKIIGKAVFRIWPFTEVGQVQ